MRRIARIAAKAWLEIQSRLARVGVWASCLVIGTVLFLAGKWAPEISGSVAPGSISQETGAAFVARLSVRAPFPFFIRGPFPGASASGPLRLLEDGVPLGPPDAQHAEIRSKGGGAYSHWAENLYFSSSDGSDPRTNGRAYVVRARSALYPLAHVAARFLLLLAIIGVATYGARLCAGGEAFPSDRSARRVIYAGRVLMLGGLLGLIVLLAFASRTREGLLDAASIKRAASGDYAAPLDVELVWPLRISSVSGSHVPGLSVILFENGGPLGNYAADPSSLAKDRDVRYAVVGNHVLFSTSDRSDPRANGRIYSWRAGLEAAIGGYALLAMLTSLGAAVGFARSFFGGFAWLAARQHALLRSARDRHILRGAQVLAVAVPCSIATYLVLLRWADGPSAHLGLEGYLPISDALGYFRCAIAAGGLAALDAPYLGSDWCSRRILYVTTLAAFLELTGWRPAVVLLLQAAVIGLAVAAFAWTTARIFSRAAALVGAAGLLIFAYDLALGNFMTEAIGLPLGILGLTLLLAYASGERRFVFLYGGLALLSVGMVARMGALFVLPAVGLWACVLLFRTQQRGRMLLCLGVAAALASGVLLQFLVVSAFDIAPKNTGGNYAATLYGLSTGSRNWHQAYHDFATHFQTSPETVVFGKIYEAALDNIRARPTVLLTSLWQNGSFFATNLLAFGPLAPFNNALLLVVALGLAWATVSSGGAAAALLMAVIVGEIVSAPLIFIGNSDHRVLSVSVAVRLLLAGVGVALLIKAWLAAFGAKLRNPASQAEDQSGSSANLAVVVGALLLAVALLPATPVRRVGPLPQIDGQGCPAGQREVIARIGRESMAIAVGTPSNPLTSPFLGLPPGHLEADPARRGAWWAEKFPAIPPGTTLIYAVQLMREGRGAFVPLILDGALPDDGVFPVSICYEPAPTSIDLGGAVFHRARAVTSLRNKS